MSTTVQQAFTNAVGALVGDYDVADVLAQLVEDCAELYPAASVAVMVRDEGENLELLSATSHRVEELELLQIQQEEGPCLDAILSGGQVRVRGADRMTERWPIVGPAVSSAGFDEVHSTPMHYRGRRIGALNMFLRSNTAADVELGAAFADIATLVVVHSSGLSSGEVGNRLHQAVTARALIEQAKGVLAYRHRLEMADAYRLLLRRSREAGETLSDTAEAVISAAYEESDA